MPLKTHQDDLPALNLTPMIDVVFLLIIFFMVGTKFTDERDIQLKVPAVGQLPANAATSQRKTISVLRDGRILLNGDEGDADGVARLTATSHSAGATIECRRPRRCGRQLPKRGCRSLRLSHCWDTGYGDFGSYEPLEVLVRGPTA